MCRQSATVCLIKSPILDDVAGLPLVERLRLLPDPRRRRGVRAPVTTSTDPASLDRDLGLGH